MSMTVGLRTACGCALCFFIGAAGALAPLSPLSTLSAQQKASVETVVARAAEYVAAFTEGLSSVVAEEKYVQDIAGSAIAAKAHRELRADILLLKIGGPLEWRPYRDVFEVDGKPLRGRDDRLVALFTQPSASSFEQAARIAQESARYNIGLARRTVNTPMLSLLFLQSAIQPRFRFRLGKNDTAVGARVWIVEYREQTKPTLVRGLSGDENTDLPASGRFWIDADTGRIPKTELSFAAIGMNAALSTTFRRDERLGLDVPATMREEYRIERRVTEMGPTDKAEGAPRVTELTAQAIVTGMATYSNFRRYEVRTGTTTAPVGN